MLGCALCSRPISGADAYRDEMRNVGVKTFEDRLVLDVVRLLRVNDHIVRDPMIEP